MALSNKDIESLIQRYLLNQLTEKEMIEFEDYYVNNPDLVDKIEVNRNIVAGLNSVNQDELRKRFSHDSKESLIGKIQKLATVAIPVPIAGIVAASLIVALFISNTQMSQPESIRLIGFSTLQTRSAHSPVVIKLFQSLEPRAVFLKVPEVNHREYFIELTPLDSEDSVWQSEPFSFSALNDKLIYIPEGIEIESVVLKLFAKGASEKPIEVRFCHYSEPCVD